MLLIHSFVPLPRMMAVRSQSLRSALLRFGTLILSAAGLLVEEHYITPVHHFNCVLAVFMVRKGNWKALQSHFTHIVMPSSFRTQILLFARSYSRVPLELLFSTKEVAIMNILTLVNAF
jgi:hypothetical protein